MNTNIEKAIEDLRINSRRYTKLERYYRGLHELSFATEKFVNAFGSQFREFAMNLCPAVCDAVKDKLKITGFAVEEGRADAELLAARIWGENRMSLRSGEVHKEALKNGDAYVIVWPDAEGRARIYPNKAESICVSYDEETPGRIVSAAKFWRESDKHTRLNLYFPDRIERYVTAKPAEGTLPEASEFIPLPAASKQPLLIDGARLTVDGSHTIENPLVSCPFFTLRTTRTSVCREDPSLKPRYRSRTG